MAQTICFRIWSAFYVVPTFYIVQERNGANEEDYFGEEYFINAVSHQWCIYGGTCVFAKEPVERFTLGEFVVTASRVATNKSDTPANISVITKESIADNNYRDAAEAISKIPGVNVLGSGAKGTSMGQDKILINGDERVLILVDGRRVNLGSSGNYSADWLPPVNAIERIEVLKGAGSALYGTDAVGGVINIITKKAVSWRVMLLSVLLPAHGIPSSTVLLLVVQLKTVWGYLSVPVKIVAATIAIRILTAMLKLCQTPVLIQMVST